MFLHFFGKRMNNAFVNVKSVCEIHCIYLPRLVWYYTFTTNTYSSHLQFIRLSYLVISLLFLADFVKEG